MVQIEHLETSHVCLRSPLPVKHADRKTSAAPYHKAFSDLVIDDAETWQSLGDYRCSRTKRSRFVSPGSIRRVCSVTDFAAWAMFNYCSAPPVARSAPPQHACDSMGFRSWALALVVSWHDACRRGPVRHTHCDRTLWVWQVISNLSVRNPMQHNDP